MDCFPPPLPDNGQWQEKTHDLKINEKKKLNIFSHAILYTLKCPAVETKYSFVTASVAFKTAPVPRFPVFFGLRTTQPSIHPPPA